MLANVALSHKGKFGETTAIIDRCIFESGVVLSWLCRASDSDRFTRYTANGLKAELELKEQISANISLRDGAKSIIEKRMLESIERCMRDSGLTEEEVATSKKLPDLASMIVAVGKCRLMYTVGQRIGSHHVHGTWVSLNVHYLERDELGNIHPRDHHCATHANQYVYISVVVLDAMSSFVGYVFPECEEREEIIGLFESTEGEILKINQEVVGDDFALL